MSIRYYRKGAAMPLFLLGGLFDKDKNKPNFKNK
jgi:hypothetical protein